LITKLKDITGVRPTSFQGAYQKTSFTVSSDSPAPVPAKENQDYYSQNSSFQAISVASIGSNSQVLGASTMCVNLTRNFHRGDESQDTKTLQTFLISNEYLDSDVSGFYGDKTVEAVKRYQRNKGLPETGMVYEFTRESIKRDSCN
jgi:peptidoglycan hydrolase-like protein with peptidoglycan-binding domain